MKLIKAGDNITWLFYCPGCQQHHGFRVERDPQSPQAPVWRFNGDETKPTFTPSLLVHGGTDRRCHLYVREGRIIYLDDCWHELKGHTVDLVDLDLEKPAGA